MRISGFSARSQASWAASLSRLPAGPVKRQVSTSRPCRSLLAASSKHSSRGHGMPPNSSRTGSNAGASHSPGWRSTKHSRARIGCGTSHRPSSGQRTSQREKAKGPAPSSGAFSTAVSRSNRLERPLSFSPISTVLAGSKSSTPWRMPRKCATSSRDRCMRRSPGLVLPVPRGHRPPAPMRCYAACQSAYTRSISASRRAWASASSQLASILFFASRTTCPALSFSASIQAT